MAAHKNNVLLALLFIFISSLVNGQEIVQKTVCWNEDFRLDCNGKSILAIHAAYFTNDPSEVSVSDCPHILLPDKQELFCKEDVKATLNKRCSGMTHCRYNLTQDHRPRLCYCRGIVVVRYACVPEYSLTQSCNTKVMGQTGYVSSPGYPRFYPKVENCGWVIQESKGQEMVLTFLDIDTRPPLRKRVIDSCPDSITVFEDFHKLRYVCGPYSNDTTRPITSTGKRIQFEFKSLDFMPSRGFLLFFKVNGCPNLEPPRHGYMVYRNKSTALYMCCKDHVFNNTDSNMLHLRCIDDIRWNGTIPACVSQEINITHLEQIKLDIVEVYMNKNKYLEEILIPTACVVGLIFGHVAAIILAMKIRRNRKTSSTQVSQTPVPATAVVPIPQPSAPTVSVIPQRAPTVAVIPQRAPTVLITDL